MFLVTSNKSKQLVHLNYIQRVEPDEIRRGLEDVKLLLADLSPGFRVLADFSRLDFMGLDCVPEIGRGMELFDQNGVGLVVRVMPDPNKDIGLNIMSAFHYTLPPQTITCENLIEAARALAL